jgi:CHAD domain-containing protein
MTGIDEWLEGAIADLEGLGLAVRRDAPDAVHKARTTTRRLRTVLRVIPGAAAKQARRALRAYGELLGAARDLEVRADLAEQLIDESGGDEATDAARDRLVAPARRAYHDAHRHVVAYLDGPAYNRLLARLAAVVDDAAGVDDLAVRHEARKSARSMRYLAEVVGDVATAAAGAERQGVLGEHRDLTLLARSLEGEADPVLVAVRETARARAAELLLKK